MVFKHSLGIHPSYFTKEYVSDALFDRMKLLREMEDKDNQIGNTALETQIWKRFIDSKGSACIDSKIPFAAFCDADCTNFGIKPERWKNIKPPTPIFSTGSFESKNSDTILANSSITGSTIQMPDRPLIIKGSRKHLKLPTIDSIEYERVTVIILAISVAFVLIFVFYNFFLLYCLVARPWRNR